MVILPNVLLNSANYYCPVSMVIAPNVLFLSPYRHHLLPQFHYHSCLKCFYAYSAFCYSRGSIISLFTSAMIFFWYPHPLLPWFYPQIIFVKLSAFSFSLVHAIHCFDFFNAVSKPASGLSKVTVQPRVSERIECRQSSCDSHSHELRNKCDTGCVRWVNEMGTGIYS